MSSCRPPKAPDVLVTILHQVSQRAQDDDFSSGIPASPRDEDEDCWRENHASCRSKRLSDLCAENSPPTNHLRSPFSNEIDTSLSGQAKTTPQAPPAPQSPSIPLLPRPTRSQLDGMLFWASYTLFPGADLPPCLAWDPVLGRGYVRHCPQPQIWRIQIIHPPLWT